MSLGETIHRLRTEKNLSQGELADALEVSRQSISKWETNGSVPELDKLIKLSSIFGVTLDELVLGREKEDLPEQTIAAAVMPVQAVRSTGQTRKIIGIILLCFGVVVWLLLTLLGGFLAGALFSSPFLLCGVICLAFQKNVGLWCAWALFCAVDVYLRYATGINWRLTLWTLNFEPSMNYMRLATAWGQLIVLVLLTVITVLRFRRGPLKPSKRNLYILILGWGGFALSNILLPNGAFAFRLTAMDWCRNILLVVLLVFTVRYIRTYRIERHKV